MGNEPDWAVSRRRLIAALPALIFSGGAGAAASLIGKAFAVRGAVTARQVQEVRDLGNGAPLLLHDAVETGARSFAGLDLAGRTTVRLGSNARLTIDSYVANLGGVLELGEGAVFFDRHEDLPKIDVSIRSRFGLIAVRGTRFFAGPSKGVFGVFVARGTVEVRAASVSRWLVAGQGIDVPHPGAAPSEVRAWKPPRIHAALASVGL